MGGRGDGDVPQSRDMEADDVALRAYYERGTERERGRARRCFRGDALCTISQAASAETPDVVDARVWLEG